jgi:hypothetical protein
MYCCGVSPTWHLYSKVHVSASSLSKDPLLTLAETQLIYVRLRQHRRVAQDSLLRMTGMAKVKLNTDLAKINLKTDIESVQGMFTLVPEIWQWTKFHCDEYS